MSSTEPQPVHEYDVVANGYDTILNLTEAEAEAYPGGAKRRSGPLAADHPDRLKQDGAESGPQASAKARSAPNK